MDHTPPSGDTTPKRRPLPRKLVLQPHGGALKPGGDGKSGGRPPGAWKEICRELSSRQEMLDTAKKVLENPKHPAWLGAWRFLAEQGYGKPVQPISGDPDSPIVLEIVVRREA